MTQVLKGADVRPSPERCKPVPALHALLNPQLPRGWEATSHPEESFAGPWTGHALVMTLHHAFNEHHPLVLSPDMFWLLVVQGLAGIVQLDPEAHRDRFVRHDGQRTIEIQRDDFALGDASNDWPGVFDEFSTRLREEIGADAHEGLVVDFSTTGPREHAANQIALMDVLQHFFRYEIVTLCGIPEVHLQGTAEDWDRLLTKTTELGARYECSWWTDHCIPWLQRTAACAAGAEDRELWEGIYKAEDMSGGYDVNGWITQFFPHLGGLRNPLLGLALDEDAVADPGDFPFGLSEAPFTWKYHARRYEMAFVGGFLGTSQDPASGALRPEIGWAVRHTERPASTTDLP